MSGTDARDRAALVLFSGGQDSATCLAWALERFDRVETIAFDYGQRHRVELQVRADFLSALRKPFPAWSERLGEDHVLDASVLKTIGDTAMTAETAIEIGENGLPTTFTPGRNLLFFTLAGALAYRRDMRNLVGGMCETDFSGYPDCRDDTLKAQQVALSLGLGRPTVLHTPLMWLDKSETFSLAEQLGGAPLLDLILESTHSCYLGERKLRHDWGYGCGVCPACQLRQAGWKRFVAQRAASSA